MVGQPEQKDGQGGMSLCCTPGMTLYDGLLTGLLFVTSSLSRRNSMTRKLFDTRCLVEMTRMRLHSRLRNFT